MKKIYRNIIAIIMLSSVVWIPLSIYFLRVSSPPVKDNWIVTRGLVLGNGTIPIFNAAIIVWTDEAYMEKGFTNKTGYFEVNSPYPQNYSIPVQCFVYAKGYADVSQVKKFPYNNLTMVSQDDERDYWGYVDFTFALELASSNSTGGV